MTSPHLLLPGVNLLGDVLQLCDAVVLGGLEDTLEVSDTLPDGFSHLVSLLRSLGTLVQGGAEPGQGKAVTYAISHTCWITSYSIDVLSMMQPAVRV